MTITIMSGKGGAGKTTLSVSLALELAERGKHTLLVDLDVEEPNTGIFIDKQGDKRLEASVMQPVWNSALCSHCGKCTSLCQFHALVKLPDGVMIFPDLCHSCYACSDLCPVGALPMKPARIGEIVRYTAGNHLLFIEGILDVGQEISSVLVRQTRDIALSEDVEIRIFDAPPGTACAAREALNRSDLVIVVTEPTPFGLHDADLALKLSRASGKKTLLVVNRADGEFPEMEAFLKKENITVTATFPWIRELSQSYSEGKLDPKGFPGFYASLQTLAETILNSPEGAR
ncbi:MAG: AAA family ATPase [Spirochaetales bacterium]|nr:AAA family ATPase [Spirochaetales bacterium]